MLFAMASGATVVATPFAQAAELLRDSGSGRPGVLVPFNSSAAIAEAVRQCRTPVTASYVADCHAPVGHQTVT